MVGSVSRATRPPVEMGAEIPLSTFCMCRENLSSLVMVIVVCAALFTYEEQKMDWSNVVNKSALCCKLPVGEVAVPRLASTESRVSPVAVPPQEHKKPN